MALARTIHEGFYCNRRHAAATSLAAGFTRPSGRARHSAPQHTVSSISRALAPPRTRLAWRLRGFVTNPHEYCGLASVGAGIDAHNVQAVD